MLRLMWSGERSVRFDGEYYWLRGAHPGPAPAHPIGIWLGAYGPRMLGVTGRMADGWLPSATYLPPERLGAAQARIDDAADRRRAVAVRRAAPLQRVGHHRRRRRRPHGPIRRPRGDVGRHADAAGGRGAHRRLHLRRPATATTKEPQLRRFAEEVAPAVRAPALHIEELVTLLALTLPRVGARRAGDSLEELVTVSVRLFPDWLRGRCPLALAWQPARRGRHGKGRRRHRDAVSAGSLSLVALVLALAACSGDDDDGAAHHARPPMSRCRQRRQPRRRPPRRRCRARTSSARSWSTSWRSAPSS